MTAPNETRAVYAGGTYIQDLLGTRPPGNGRGVRPRMQEPPALVARPVRGVALRACPRCQGAMDYHEDEMANVCITCSTRQYVAAPQRRWQRGKPGRPTK